MFRINWFASIFALILILPGSLVMPCFNRHNARATKNWSKAKAEANALAEERISNVRTVKAFADEDDSTAKFAKLNEDTYQVALWKGKLWGIFMGSIVTFTGAAICAQIAIVSTQVEETNFFFIKKITIGEVLTYLMYMQILTRNVGGMLSEAANLGKIQGATVAIAEIIYAHVDVNPVGT